MRRGGFSCGVGGLSCGDGSGNFLLNGLAKAEILDPWLRKAYRLDGTSMVQVSELATADSRVSLSVSLLF
jgi:hypothetical protein